MLVPGLVTRYVVQLNFIKTVLWNYDLLIDETLERIFIGRIFCNIPYANVLLFRLYEKQNRNRPHVDLLCEKSTVMTCWHLTGDVWSHFFFLFSFTTNGYWKCFGLTASRQRCVTSEDKHASYKPWSVSFPNHSHLPIFPDTAEFRDNISLWY